MKVIGILTFGAVVPGLNFHRRKVVSVAESSMLFPVLCAIVASVTLPLAGSTDTTHTPLPVIFFARHSYGYGGRGAETADAFALDMFIVPEGALGALIGVTLVCGLFKRGGGVVSSTNSGLMSGIGGASGIGMSSGGGVGCSSTC